MGTRGRRAGTSRITRATWAVVVVALATVGCTSGDDEAAPDLCALLAAPAPTPVAKDVDTQVPTGSNRDVLAALLTPSDVVIYLDPEVDDDGLEAFAETVRDRPDVATADTLNRAETYAQFQEMFAGEPDVLASAPPESLPLSVRVRVDDVGATDRFVAWARAQSTTYEVRETNAEVTGSLLMVLFSTDGQREQWRTLAEDLRAVDEPWTVDAATVIDLMLSDATNGRGDAAGEDRLVRIQDGLIAAGSTCTASTR